MPSVLLPWVEAMPWKLQSILQSGFRGPDTGNYPEIKKVNRWLRTVSQGNADPSKQYMQDDGLPAPLVLCSELEWLPCHYVHHLADAVAVVAYCHPDGPTARLASSYHYTIAEELFHFVPEQPAVFLLRHRDKPGGQDAHIRAWHEAALRAEDRYFAAVDMLQRG